MAYREITMIEIKEVLRRWISGIPKKRLAAQLGLDPKTVRRYVQVAEQCGVRLEDGLAGLTDDHVNAVIIALKQPAAHPHVIATSSEKGLGLPELRATILSLA